MIMSGLKNLNIWSVNFFLETEPGNGYIKKSK